MNKIILASLIGLSIFSGAAFFLLYNNWITVTIMAPGFVKTKSPLRASAQKKTVTLWYWHNNQLKQEKKELFWTENTVLNCSALIKGWLDVLDEEGVLPVQSSVQSIAITPHNQELIISFDRSPLNHEQSTFDKLMLIQSMLKTLSDCAVEAHAVPARSVRFLVHHQPLDDDHLDFSRPWPIQGFIPTSDQCQKQKFSFSMKKDEPFTIMLDPSGDSQKTGRIIDDTFERGITLQCAEKLKLLLEAEFSTLAAHPIRIILTRVPGETVDVLQNASFANRLNVDLYLSLNFYQTPGPEMQAHLYYVAYHPVSDFWFNQTNQLNLIHYNQAHLLALKRNCSYAQQLFTQLKKYARSSGFIIKEPLGVPFKPLIGITSPALAIEAGLKTKDAVQKLLHPLTQAIKTLMMNGEPTGN